MKIKYIIPGLLAILVSSCTTFQTKKIIFNERKQLYVYEINKINELTLRNDKQQLVDTANIKEFREEIENIKNKYPFGKRREKDELLKRSDYQLSELYRDINDNLNKKNYQKAIFNTNILLNKYPDSYKYSDCLFLEAYAFEKSGEEDSAIHAYNKFLQFSSQKYSIKFRGYINFDINDSLFIKEREYSMNYLSGRNPVRSFDFIKIKPKYYYGSFQPGYSYNANTYKGKSLGALMVLIGTDYTDEIALGFQAYLKIKNEFYINPRFWFSPNMIELDMAIPVQVYKSESNNLGFKITPFIQYQNIDSIKIENNVVAANENFINFGARVSAGYYLFQNLSIGSYYQYHFFNENNKYITKNSLYNVWHDNVFDISLYYNIYKSLSLKAGIKNNDIVAGFFINGWEIGYNISNPGIVLSVDMY